MNFQIIISRLIIPIIGILMLYMPQEIQSQDLEKEFSEFMEDIHDEYDEGLKAYRKEQQQFLDSVNAGFIQMMEAFDLEFQEMLKDEWHPHTMDKSVTAEGMPGAVGGSETRSDNARPVIPPIGSITEEAQKTDKTQQIEFFG